MAKNQTLTVVLSLICSLLLFLVIYCTFYYFSRKRFRPEGHNIVSLEDGGGGSGAGAYTEEGELQPEELVKFAGGESLTAIDILEAPGEVVGKSSYGTLYRATVARSSSAVLLRFVRPACVGRAEEVLPAAQLLGGVSHPNLVPLRALYIGPRGEKLFVHPFYAAGTLAQFIGAGVSDAHRWDIIYKLSCGIAKGLDHLHNGFAKPIIHGNLKTNNILLDADYQPRLSDFGLHLILNPTASQEMLEAASAQGYKAPELIKLRDANRETDVYSLGVVLLELLTQKDPFNNNFLQSKDLHLPTSLRNLVLEHKVSDAFNPELLLNRNGDLSSTNEEGLLMLMQLAMACCSPSPTLRPAIKLVLKRLDEICR